MLPDDDWFYDFPTSDAMLIIAICIRCGGNVIEHPDKTPVVWINTTTMCPVRPDGTLIQPGESGTAKEPLCHPCLDFLKAHPTGPVTVLFPRARLDRITPPPAEEH